MCRASSKVRGTAPVHPACCHPTLRRKSMLKPDVTHGIGGRFPGLDGHGKPDTRRSLYFITSQHFLWSSICRRKFLRRRTTLTPSVLNKLMTTRRVVVEWSPRTWNREAGALANGTLRSRACVLRHPRCWEKGEGKGERVQVRSIFFCVALPIWPRACGTICVRHCSLRSSLCLL